jgi:tRNA1(Val) A37 N6-methylase TrmN6
LDAAAAAVAHARGAYYTPAELARPLCAWALRGRHDTVLDPSCGEGVFLAAGVERLLELGADPRGLADQVAGVEVDPPSLARARGALLSRHPALRWSGLLAEDFFSFARRAGGAIRFDAVVGNPPYLRTQGRSFQAKRDALEAARRAGVDLGADASAWAPFVAAAMAFVRPGGRLAMVVPREALFTNYAKPLLAALQRRFARTTLAALDEPWFDGALVKVALLLADGEGPGTLAVRDGASIADLDAVTSTPTASPDPSWVWSRIPASCRDAAKHLLDSSELAPLTELGTLRIGVVTGDKDYFLVDGSDTHGLPEAVLPPAISTPAQLKGSVLRAEDVSDRLLSLPPDYAGGDAAIDAYLDRGRKAGVDAAYKCRTRKPWYSVKRQLPPPDLFLGYVSKRRVRAAANAAGAHSTNNVHRFYLKPEWKAEAALIAAASLNAASMLSAELLGRIAAGGALKVEPGDASTLRWIRPERLIHASGATHRAAAIDRALREGREEDAFALADGWAAGSTGWDPRTLARARRAQRALRDARL